MTRSWDLHLLSSSCESQTIELFRYILGYSVSAFTNNRSTLLPSGVALPCTIHFFNIALERSDLFTAGTFTFQLHSLNTFKSRPGAPNSCNHTVITTPDVGTLSRSRTPKRFLHYTKSSTSTPHKAYTKHLSVAMKSFSTVSAIAALAACASAHINMKSPTPFNPAPDTSPLSPGGANYPCKAAAGGLTIASQSTASVGSTVQMSFSGSAVHGGGSCQVSLSKDGASSLNAGSEFKVIYSILGGCPGTDGSTVSYDVPIPAEVPAGEYTFAWTWFNKIGNREMYMNCAPISIEGGSGTDATFSGLPDMAIYNIASKNECKTVEGSDVQFPNPGQYVMTGAGFKPGQPTCDGTSAD